MIESFRKYTGLMIVVLVLLFIGLVFLDGGSISRALGGKPVMQVGGEAISQKDYDRQVALLSISRALPSHPLPRDTRILASHYLGNSIIDQPGLAAGNSGGFNLGVLDQMSIYLQGLPPAPEKFITNRINVQKAGIEYGVRPGDEELESFVENVLFADPEGNFDQAAYEDFLKNRVSRIGGNKGFTEYVRDLLTAMNLSKIVGGGLAPEMETVRLAYDTQKQIINGKQIVLTSAPLEGKVKPTQDELQAYFKENGDKYKSDELRKVSYVLIEPNWEEEAKKKAEKEAEAKRKADEAKKKADEEKKKADELKKKAEEAAAKANKAKDDEEKKGEGSAPTEAPKPTETPAPTPTEDPKPADTPTPTETPAPAEDPAPAGDPQPAQPGSEGDPGDPGQPAPAGDPEPAPAADPAPAPAADPAPATDPAPTPAPAPRPSLTTPSLGDPTPTGGRKSGLEDLLKDSKKDTLPGVGDIQIPDVPKTPKEQLNSFEKSKAVEAMAPKASELFEALNDNLDKPFAEIAKSLNYEVKKTEFFSQKEAPEPLNATVQNDRQGGTVADLIFKLPTSGDADFLMTDPIQTEHGWIIARFEDITDAAELPYQDVRVKVSIDLKKEMASEQLAKDAKEIHEKLVAALEEGKSFEDAAKELDQKVTDLNDVSSGQEFNLGGRTQTLGGHPAFEHIKLTNPGKLAPIQFDSEEKPTTATIILVEKREIEKNEAYLDKLETEFRNQTRYTQLMAFENWLNDRYSESDVVPPKVVEE